MATRLKTIEFAFPTLASSVNNTLTNFTQITIYIPESSPVFKSVVVKITANDIVTATGGSITTNTIGLRLAAVAYNTVTGSTTAKAHTGESVSWLFAQEFAGYFTTNWSGTSMTCDVQFQFNQSTGTTLGLVNISCTVEITYEYDDTSATHIKTVYIPLNVPVGALATTKPGAANDTIPALDTELPEASKTYRNMFIVIQGNEQRGAVSTDHTLQAQIDSYTQLTSGNFEGALQSDRWFLYVWDITGLGMTTNATHGFYIWSSVARNNHLQAYLVVTYEFSPSTSTTIFNSIRMPLKLSFKNIGGTTSSDYTRLFAELWIEEPTTITSKQIAAFLFWLQANSMSGLNARLGTGSFVTYTDGGGTYCGDVGLMIRNDAAFTLARGRNIITVDIYRTDTIDFGGSLNGFVILNYTSGKATDGVGAHNHTVLWNIFCLGTSSTLSTKSATVQPGIPETNYFLSSLGVNVGMMGSMDKPSFFARRLSASEGNQDWENLFTGNPVGTLDAEIGMQQIFACSFDQFKQFTGDVRGNKLDLEASRLWGYYSVGTSVFTTWVMFFELMFSYHSITKTVSGTISGSGGGTVNLYLQRANSNTNDAGQRLLTGSRSGNGAYSFTWFDDTEKVCVDAYEDGTHLGKSIDDYAT